VFRPTEPDTRHCEEASADAASQQREDRVASLPLAMTDGVMTSAALLRLVA